MGRDLCSKLTNKMHYSRVLFTLLYFVLKPSEQAALKENETNTKSKFEEPQWEDLECQPGHKYLFVADWEERRNWEDARSQCASLGGWLVDIQDIHEQNCLTRHAYKTDGLTDIYWTDASDQDEGNEGVWMHTSTNTEVTWFGPKGITCYSAGDWAPMGGHALFIMFGHGSTNGEFCDYDMTSELFFICKALI